MNSKTPNLCYLLSAFLFGGVSVLTSCDNEKDVYNPDHIQEEARKAFPVKDIDPNQTWETSAVCNASVSVNEETGGAYTVKVYTENPYNTNGDAFLLAKASVADGQTVNFNFDIPAALQYVYVMKVNDKGFSSAIPVAVENGTVKVAFGATTTRTADTRGNGDKFFTPEVPGNNIFPTTPPINCGDIKEYDEQKNTIPYLLKDNTYSGINPWQGGDFYIQGNVIIESWSEPGHITNFYLLPNATLTLKMAQFNHRQNSVFSIGNGARLTANNTTLKGESGSKYFNKGTILAQKIEITNAYLYNAKEINTGKVLLTNNDSKICNAPGAQLTMSELEIQGNGHFMNETDGVVNCQGATTLNCSNGSWENAGHYTTETMHTNAWNKNIKNSCWLQIKNKLTFNESGIYNEGYIGCSDLCMENTIVNMAANSFFEVKNEATLIGNYNDNNTKGFIASTTAGSWALLKVGKTANNNQNWKNVAYIGKLYIACDNHFSIGDEWNPIYKIEDGAQMTSADNADIQIPASSCNPGYNSNPDEGGTDKVQTYAYAFEDMAKAVGDYDFNDVVLHISTPIATGKGKMKEIAVTLQAAGAAKQIAVLFRYKGEVQTIFENVHTALGVAGGTLTNTGSASAKAVTQMIEVDEDFSLTNDGDFYISIDKGEVHIPNFIAGFKPGNAPYAIRIAHADWKWAKESIKIIEAYPNFTEWAQDATQESNWYENPQEGKVME